MSDGARAFIDTNILLHLYGNSDRRKQARAVELIGELTRNNRALVSTQVIQEFYVNARRLGIAGAHLAAAISALFQLHVVVLQEGEVRNAIEKHERYQISFWDGLILAAAESGGADVVYTEDLNHGQRYGSVLVQNPFIASPALEAPG